jgi:hypothetical protein
MTKRARTGRAHATSAQPRGRALRHAAAAAFIAVALSPSAALAGGPDCTPRPARATCATAPGADAAAAPEPSEADLEDKKYEGLFGALRPGVMAAVAPLPQGLYGVEVGVKYKRWASVGAQFSGTPTIVVGPASATLNTFSLNGRFHPFRGGFFLGASLGRSSIHAEASDEGQTARVEATRTFVTPGFGWLYTLPSGLSLGFMSLGVNVPLTGDVKTELPAAAAVTTPDLAQKANDLAKPLGRQVLPSVELFRIGFLL